MLNKLEKKYNKYDALKNTYYYLLTVRMGSFT